MACVVRRRRQPELQLTPSRSDGIPFRELMIRPDSPGNGHCEYIVTRLAIDGVLQQQEGVADTAQQDCSR